MATSKIQVFQLYEKEGDDFDDALEITSETANMSGWTFACFGKPESAVTTDVSAASFVATVTCSVSGNILTVTVPSSATAHLVTEGRNTDYYYADIEATTDLGKKKTVADLVYQVYRKYTI
jgi:hypothetical protein